MIDFLAVKKLNRSCYISPLCSISIRQYHPSKKSSYQYAYLDFKIANKYIEECNFADKEKVNILQDGDNYTIFAIEDESAFVFNSKKSKYYFAVRAVVFKEEQKISSSTETIVAHVINDSIKCKNKKITFTVQETKFKVPHPRLIARDTTIEKIEKIEKISNSEKMKRKKKSMMITRETKPTYY